MKRSPHTRHQKLGRLHIGMYAALVMIAGFLIVNLVRAATPNPGHPWGEVGDGIWAATGTTALRTFTFPDTNATILTNAAAVTVAQGGTGTSSLTGIVIGNGAAAFTASSTLGSGSGGTGNAFTKFSGPASSEKVFTLPNANATVLTDNAAVTLAQGGTGASLTASNGGIFYSTGSAGAILAGTATAGQVLRSGASGAPSWSTATYPATAGTSGNYLISDGTNWISAAPPTAQTILTRSFLATGATQNGAINSLTTSTVGLFNLHKRITINQLSMTVAAVTTAGTFRVCIYDEQGTSKLLDVTSGTVAAGTLNITVSPAVTLDPDNYYITLGCATTCSDTVAMFVSTAVASVNGASVPSGKRVYEGTVTRTSGTCNSTLGTVTGAISRTPVIRLDN